jgi:hypothetical protein
MLLADTDAATTHPELISATSASLLWDEGAVYNAMMRICVYNPVVHGEGASSFSPFKFLECSTAKMTSVSERCTHLKTVGIMVAGGFDF